jgi:hypothetical protein
MQFWKPGDIFTVDCPRCGGAIEFFKDEPVQPCPSCKNEVRNPKIDLGCAKWCKMAKECLGVAQNEKPEPSMLDRLAAAVAGAMELGPDQKARADRALDFARRIVAAEGGDAMLVQAAVLFNEAARHSRLTQCRPFEPSDTCQTKLTLEKVGLAESAIQRVCQLLWALHTGLEDDSREFAAAWDATQLTLLDPTAGDPSAIPSQMRTSTGQRIARELLGAKKG